MSKRSHDAALTVDDNDNDSAGPSRNRRRRSLPSPKAQAQTPQASVPAPPAPTASTSTSSPATAAEQPLPPPPSTIVQASTPPPEPIEYEDEDDYEPSSTFSITEENEHLFFRTLHGRVLNTMKPDYLLPVDRDELRQQDHFHKMCYLLQGGKNYVGEVPRLLGSSPADRRRKRVLDIGTGGGLWAMQIADEFPKAIVTGVDLAPIQPKLVPPNLTFELFDAQVIPYPDQYFDVVHARAVHIGFKDYRKFLLEVARVLRPGGIAIFIETEYTAYTDNKVVIEPGTGGAQGWLALWEQYRRCLVGMGIDTTVPTNLRTFVQATGAFDKVVGQEALVPVGFWPKDPNVLAVAEYAWMANDELLTSIRPLFLNYGLTEYRVNVLIEDAQSDLYHPLAVRPYSCVHITHAYKAATWHPPLNYPRPPIGPQYRYRR